MSSLATTERPGANAINKAFRQKDALRLQFAEATHAPVLDAVSRRIADGALNVRQILLTTGLGLSSRPGLPVRLPALLLPGLRVMEEFRRMTGDSPGYLVYQATDFIADANNIPVDEARGRAQQMKEYIRSYIKTFHADVSRQVALAIGDDDKTETRTGIDRIAQHLHQRSTEDPVIGTALASLQSAETKHANGANSHLRYAAANVLFNGADDEQYPYLAEAKDRDSQVILPIGGRAEKPFFALTSAVAKTSTRTVIPLVTSLGSRPTYYPYPDLHDPCSLDELANVRVRDAHILGDLSALANAGANAVTLQSVFPSHQ